jgi:hypothetical protein
MIKYYDEKSYESDSDSRIPFFQNPLTKILSSTSHKEGDNERGERSGDRKSVLDEQ